MTEIYSLMNSFGSADWFAAIYIMLYVVFVCYLFSDDPAAKWREEKELLEWEPENYS